MKVSIITITYNSAKTVEETIQSVMSQDYQNIEYIIIDGASTDTTKDIISSYNDSITTFVSEPDNGLYDALNKGLKHASGDIVGFLHSDDFYYDNSVVSQIVAGFDQDEKIDAVYGDLVYVNQENVDKTVRYWISGQYSKSKLKFGWMPPHPTFYARLEVYKKYGGFNTSYKISADYDSILRYLGKNNIFCHYVPEIFIKMRNGGVSNRSIRNIIQKTKEDYLALKENNVGSIFTVILKNILKVSQFFSRKLNEK